MTQLQEKLSSGRQETPSGMTDRSRSSVGRRAIVSEEDCFLSDLLQTLYRITTKRRHQRGSLHGALSMFSSQRQFEWSVLIRNVCPSRY